MSITKIINSNELPDYILSDEKLKKLQNIELQIYLDVEQSCKKRNIPIYIFYGTLLGAIRHKGFIPWDDDIDSVAYLDDIQKIIDAVKEDYGDKYFFGGILSNDNNDPFFGLKIMLSGTSAVEFNASGYPVERGIFIDIFPIIKTSDNALMRKIHGKRMITLIHMVALGFEYKFPPKLLPTTSKGKSYYRFRKFIGFWFAPFVNYNKNKLLKLYKKYKNTKHYAFDFVVGHNKGEEIFYDTIFENHKYDFEGHKLNSFKNGKLLTRMRYGENYMELPPIEKRERHVMAKLDFGKYE